MFQSPFVKRLTVALATPPLTFGLGKRRWPETTGSQKKGHGQGALLGLPQARSKK